MKTACTLPASFLILLLVGFLFSACTSEPEDAEDNDDMREESAGMTDGANSRPLAPNFATDEELADLPYLTPNMIGQMKESRPFVGMLEFDSFVGEQLDSTQKADLYSRLFIPLNLNTAGREEILLVPGVGNRMAHEFEEYRPYTNIEQFRREIGKYVDDNEVARLEQFVFVPIDLNTATDEDILALPGIGNRFLHEFKEYRPYTSMEQFRREMGKYVDEREVARMERLVEIRDQN